MIPLPRGVSRPVAGNGRENGDVIGARAAQNWCASNRGSAFRKADARQSRLSGQTADPATDGCGIRRDRSVAGV